MKILLATAATLALVGGSSSAFAQAGPIQSANANASAEIVTPISIAADPLSPLAFGTLAANAAASTVVMSHAGLRSDPDNIVLASSGAGSAAKFVVGGQGSLAYTVSLPATATLNAPGGFSMSVSGLNTDDVTRNLTTGIDGFNVGGTLNVGGGQAPGNYSGTFAASVQYD